MSLFPFRIHKWSVILTASALLTSADLLIAQDPPVELRVPEINDSDTTTPSGDEEVTTAPSELSEKSEKAPNADATEGAEPESTDEKTVKAEKIPVDAERPKKSEGDYDESSEPAIPTVPVEEKPKERIEHADPLLNKVEEAIELSSRRFLTNGLHTPWQIMHGILAFRDEYEILAAPNSQDKLNAIKFISNNPSFDGKPWFLKSPYGGKAHPFTVPYAFEGHPNQFPAIMTMTDLPLDHQFLTPDGPITMQDIVKNAQMEVNNHEGQTWTLWFLTHYLPSDTEWRNARGENWSIERLVQMQNQVAVERSACGGCHNLFALALARNNHLQEGGQIRGVWLEANQKILRYTEIARRTQNRDGSLSSDYFRAPQFSNEFKRRVATSGHMMEFLMVALPQSQLKEQWVRRAIDSVATDLIRFRNEPADVGALYHAVDALVIFRERSLPRELATSSTEEPSTSPEVGEEGVAINGTVVGE
ncbi:MAG: hypothetical protein CMJ46_07785 [Planctomyces sp.]|nr:hypothetical protein [Planctomyces sp.]